MIMFFSFKVWVMHKEDKIINVWLFVLTEQRGDNSWFLIMRNI